MVDLYRNDPGISDDSPCRIIPFCPSFFIRFIIPPERKAQEPGDFVSDITKIRGMLGWEPTVSLREGLSRTVDFYRERRAEYF